MVFCLKTMFIFLFGKDNYRSRQKLKEIISQYQAVYQSGLNFKIYDIQNLSFQDFKNEFQQSAMFEEKKLIVLKNVFSNDLFKEKFLKEKKIFLDSEDIIIFFEQTKVLKSNKLFPFLRKNAEFQEEFKVLEGEKLINWINKKFKEDKMGINKDALNKLIDSVGYDSWRMVNAIKKLIHYKKAIALEENILNPIFLKVSVKEVELLVKPKVGSEIFATIDSLADRNKKKALELIENHLEKGDSPFYLLSMIDYQFRNLIIIKKNEADFNNPGLISRNTGIKFYQVMKLINLAKKFSLEELKKIFQKIFKTDLDIKTGRIDPEQGIKMLIAEL